MANIYSLNLTADLSGDSTGYFNAYSNNLMSRCWVSTPLPRAYPTIWSPCNVGGNGGNNSDLWGPTLTFHRNTPATSDQVQFQVFYTNLQAGWQLSSVNIYVSFGAQGRTNAANQTASPFTNGSNARCILADTPNTNNNSTNPAQFIGPYLVNINPNAVTGNSTLSFEFSIVCSFVLMTLTPPPNRTFQTYQFGYDPEMDLSVET